MVGKTASPVLDIVVETGDFGFEEVLVVTLVVHIRRESLGVLFETKAADMVDYVSIVVWIPVIDIDGRRHDGRQREGADEGESRQRHERPDPKSQRDGMLWLDSVRDESTADASQRGRADDLRAVCRNRYQGLEN